ncbi:MAG: type VI secretion system lipoprotein TssJ [Zoogloeaceae bacterium]|nr:type VI secretion system lipoprotein TssJ [Zoogloeaceae bacterium]
MWPNAGTLPSPTRRLLVLAGALYVAACASPPKPVVTKIEGKVVAAADANPDSKGRPSPVIVRIFELKSLAAFSGADFFSLWNSDSAALGAELAAREELALKPGDNVALDRTIQPGVTHFGAIVAYRDLERAVWRAAIPVPVGQTTKVTVTVGPRSLTIAPAP